jgi:hypothetical protein
LREKKEAGKAGSRKSEEQEKQTAGKAKSRKDGKQEKLVRGAGAMSQGVLIPVIGANLLFLPFAFPASCFSCLLLFLPLAFPLLVAILES